MFKESDKVVCVDDTPRFKSSLGTYPGGWIVKGEVYDVAAVSEMTFGDGPSLRIFVTGKPVLWTDGTDYGWQPYRFRKLSEVQAENERARTLVRSNGGEILHTDDSPSL